MTEYAHKVAPAVDGSRFVAESDPSDVAAQMVAYHAARAFGFIKGWEASRMAWTEGLSQGLLSFELAMLYHRWACTDLDAADRETVSLVEILESPELIESEIDGLLNWCEIDPAEIRPYHEAGDPR